MRRFLVISHTVPTDGAWPLEDLPGAGGRVDVLCRIVGAAMFLSHGIRDDTEVILVFAAGPEPVAVRFDGTVNRLQPDERSTAARIRQALQAAHPDPWWNKVQQGLHVAPFGLEEALQEAGGHPVLLDRDGAPWQEADLPAEPLFVLSDHLPFTAKEQALLENAATSRLSVGGRWLHGDHVVHVVQHLLDHSGNGGVK